jgi:glycosyltransferase involved in cell wall biosynthesis
MDPLVSILTPSLNRIRWLPDTLQSVSQQTYATIEHIVMDGGSTDGTVEFLRTAGPHVRWRSEPDHGESNALNKALAESKGQIIGWLNSDDAYADRRVVATAVDMFRRHPEVAVVYGHGILVNPNNRMLQFLWAPKFNRQLMKFYQFFVEPAVFIRRSAIPEPFVREDLNYLMYFDLWMRLVDTVEFRRMDIVAGVDRHHPGRKTLTPGYLEECRKYNLERGVRTESTSRRLLMKVTKVGLRVAGAVPAIRVPGALNPAIELRFDEPIVRLVRQTMVQRKTMPLE